MSDPVREAQLREEAARATRAELLLKDDILADAFDGLERSYITAWRNTDARDTDGRERLFLAVQVVGKVKRHLELLVGGGTLARAELEQIRRHGGRKPEVV